MLVVLESMKMELSVAAPHAGVVAGLAVKPGDKVALRAKKRSWCRSTRRKR